MNGTYALSKVHGKEAAIAEAEKLKLTSNYLYFTLLGELYKDLDPQKSLEQLECAHRLAKTEE